MIQLHKHGAYYETIHLDEDTGTRRSGRADGNTVGVGYELPDGRIAASYDDGSGRLFQVGARKWCLSDPRVRCRYFRALRWEFFSIGDDHQPPFRVVASYPLWAVTQRFEPATDRLDWDAPFFFLGVWTAWRSARQGVHA